MHDGDLDAPRRHEVRGPVRALDGWRTGKDRSRGLGGGASPSLHPPPDIYIPAFAENNFADLLRNPASLSSSSQRDGDVPVYWHIPKSGGTTVQDIIGHCLGLVQASDLARETVSSSLSAAGKGGLGFDKVSPAEGRNCHLPRLRWILRYVRSRMVSRVSAGRADDSRFWERSALAVPSSSSHTCPFSLFNKGHISVLSVFSIRAIFLRQGILLSDLRSVCSLPFRATTASIRLTCVCGGG